MGEEIDEEDDINFQNKVIKCPRIMIELNNIKVEALIDTGSEVSGISETWYEDNKNKLGKFEILNVSNTTIKCATGTKSRLIRKQILLEAKINHIIYDIVLLVIPNLIKDCIIGIDMLREWGGIINLPQEVISFTDTTNNNNQDNEVPENNNIAQLLTIEHNNNDDNYDIIKEIYDDIESIECLEFVNEIQLSNLLIKK